ncbi:hypothetical protein CLV63_11947 [Murinocardiopsis flavida]|uniref:Glyoxalase-like domain-containing protein n=1 Tax=Murinocardiopsis flavida TaxID=645275 RepID=A0A2P8D3J8_9ACTN|nr:VOC family protein [Murinocardiopsis flavida]PSK91766.1 hypothetical protein CLV63_11947 [Murinocardiopsis flavida]
MAVHWKLVVDCADPLAIAEFWAQALDYEVEDHSALIDRLRGAGVIEDAAYTVVDGRKAWLHASGVRHPEDPVDPDTGVGLGRRLLFNVVPEAKQVKNRLHIDLHFDPGQRDAQVRRLEGLGAKAVQAVEEPGSSHVVMSDPEGNEFCVH